MVLSVRSWLHHPLTHNVAFMHLWAGQTAAEIGFQVGALATSAIAISLLHASETQIGLLSALQTLAFLLVGLPAGAWVDRWRKRHVMIAANLTRITALTSIPLAYILSSLTLVHLMVVATILGLSTVFFDVAYQSYVPLIASKRYIGAANGRLEASYQVGLAGGPGLGGWLLGVVAPPLAYLLTASTYVCSTWAIWRIRTPEPRPAHSEASLRSQIVEGLSFVRGQRLLFPLFSCIACAAFAAAGIQVLLPILVLRTLGMSATQLGLLLCAGALGGIFGALTRPAWITRLGIGRCIVATNIIGVSVLLAQPASVHVPGAATWVIACSGVISSYFITIYNVTQMSLRQEICPPDMLGRMNAIFRFAVWGVMPLGSLASGVVASWAGVEATMYIFTAISIAAGIAMGFTPAARIRGASAAEVS
ncbi:MFS transporter [Actinomyces sp. oral taxon 172]|uniref:MFS transporter n=2 Tax=Actinomycetaceae TaxID=2049 RepID=UPI0003980605|nr:MFS transporter [Actinomyces sp. oral taxon 172]ERH31642.1 transporter, major facilitator family protein [Actinomyces sp. oral taxon 172 str. F0311]